jgi:hypothetical protein
MGRERPARALQRFVRDPDGGPIHFAMFERPRTPQSVMMAPDGLELDVNLDDDVAGWPTKLHVA